MENRNPKVRHSIHNRSNTLSRSFKDRHRANPGDYISETEENDLQEQESGYDFSKQSGEDTSYEESFNALPNNEEPEENSSEEYRNATNNDNAQDNAQITSENASTSTDEKLGGRLFPRKDESNDNKEEKKLPVPLDDEVKAIIKAPAIIAFATPFIAIILVILMISAIFITIISKFSDILGLDSTKDPYGSFAYTGYYESKCSGGVTVVKEDSQKTYDYEDYIVGVVFGEVGGFQNLDVYKALAIAARTYAETNYDEDSCVISGGDTKQYFADPTGYEEYSNVKMIRQAVEETKGIFIKKNNDIMPEAAYDSFCYSEYDDNYYTLTENQKSQKIPTSWVLENIHPSENVDRIHCPCKGYADSETWKNSDKYKEWASNPDKNKGYVNQCWKSSGEWKGSGHGHGMSQYGAYYLATVEDKNFEDILKYYYGEDITLTADKKKLTKAITSISNLELKDTGDATNLHQNLGAYLSSNGSSIEELEEYIHSNVVKVGAGTREGVVVAAVSLVNYLYDNYKIKIPYYWNGKYPHIGVNSNFGDYVEGGSGDDFYKGFDCSGFVVWAITNGGYTIEEMNTTGIDGKFASGGYDWCYITEPSCIALPGDLINAPTIPTIPNAIGHVQLIVDVDESQGVYYVAHSGGDSSGNGSSLNIKVVGMHTDMGKVAKTKILHLENFYTNKSNVRANY